MDNVVLIAAVRGCYCGRTTCRCTCWACLRFCHSRLTRLTTTGSYNDTWFSHSTLKTLPSCTPCRGVCRTVSIWRATTEDARSAVIVSALLLSLYWIVILVIQEASVGCDGDLMSQLCQTCNTAATKLAPGACCHTFAVSSMLLVILQYVKASECVYIHPRHTWIAMKALGPLL